MQFAAAEAIVPRFQKLRDGQVEEKTPGEVVTVADREAERIISPRLTALLPGSRVVGEAATAETRSLMDGLNHGDVWLVDPLDGTANFVAGSSEFSMMIALMRQGQVVASWLRNPLSGQLAVATRGDGAFIDGARVQTVPTSLPLGAWRGSVLMRFLLEALMNQVEAHSSRFGAILPGAKCAGVDYPAVATGYQHFLMFWRLLPWDHAPGVLLVEEAGGHVAHLNGSEYRPSDQQPGILIAQNRDVWETVKANLLGC